MALDAKTLEWWTNDLPQEQPEVVQKYLDCYPQYAETGIPAPAVSSPDTLHWFKPDDGKWVDFNSSKQNIVEALRNCWLPEEPAVEEEESGHQCPKCDYSSRSSVGLKIHRSLRGHN